MEKNVLILSCGLRNKIIEYFKQAVGSRAKVIAADCDKHAPALYVADSHYNIPRIDHPDYLEKLLDICRKENIKLLFSLIDPELLVLAQHRSHFETIGVDLIVSEHERLEVFSDKYQMYEYVTNAGYLTPKTYENMSDLSAGLKKGEIDFPVYMKPRRGSASKDCFLVEDKKKLQALLTVYSDMIIQEYIAGEEYDSDVYIDMISKEPVSIFVKRKLRERAGEADRMISVRDDKLTQLLYDFSRDSGLSGIIDIDIIKSEGKYYILEVNPRFGGCYPHAQECGIDVPAMILKNCDNEINDYKAPAYAENIVMMKYNEISILKE